MRNFTLILSLLTASATYAQDPWLGHKLMPRYGATFMVGSHQVPEQQFNLPLIVRDVKGEWLEVGSGYIHKSDTVSLADAAAYYSDYLKKNPGSSWAFNSRGNAWQAKGDFDAALKDYSEAIRLDSKNAAAYNNRGNVWTSKGNLAAALKDFDEAIQLNPKEARVHNNRGEVWFDKGDLDAALKDYNEAIRLDPKHAAAYYNRGNAWQAKGGYPAALKDYAEAIQLDPKNADAYNNRSRLLSTTPNARIRDGKQAVEDARTACKLTEWNDPVLFDTLAAAYAEAGDFLKAVEWQTKAVEMAPEKAKDECGSRLELYRSKKPYHEEPQAK
jgi:tetratricopeptide (TPR) repeat protein